MSLFGDWDAAQSFFRRGPGVVEDVIRQGLKQAGAQMQAAVREYIRDQKGDWEPLKEATIRRKAAKNQSNKLLIADAELMREVTYEAEDDEVTCGVLSSSKRAGAARAHEYGYEPGGIPKRAYLEPAIREAADRGEIVQPFRDGVQKAVAGGRLR